jgi:D-lyxose ketol-isomerase
MKRSEINASLAWAKDFLAKNNIRLPDMAYWSMSDWRKNRALTETVRQLELGWDVTDFGSDAFAKIGAVLYTVRNGLLERPEVGVPYCEKYILMREGQRLPNHYHVFKSEDIINRAGGDISVCLWNADPKTGEKLATDVHVFMDGIKKVVRAGEEVVVTKGNSITLAPYVSHVFGPKPGTGDCIVGEVSKVNDDHTDNYFVEPVSRFATIEEDEPILHPLCNECANCG